MTEMLAATTVAGKLEELAARLDGELVLPEAENWEQARLAWNLAVVQEPAAVVYPESAADVVETVRFARTAGLRVAPQSTGHGAAPLGDLSDTILLKTERLRGVAIDAEARIARAGAGVVWAEVVEQAVEHGLTALHGSAPDVGVVGYTLGGGIGWLARRHGLAANSVTAVELVTGTGELVRVDAENEPELFWAVRGGGGGFGVVTAIEFRLYPVRELYAGVLFFPVERAAEVLHAWRAWVETVPEEMTSVGRLMSFPPFPDVPESLRGKSFALVEAAFLGDESDGAALLRPLRELRPALDTFAPVPAAALSDLHMDPPHPVPGAGDGLLLRDAPADAIDVLVAHEQGGSPLLSVELRHLGGALGRVEPGAGVAGSLEAGFALFAVGIAPTPETKEAVESHTASLTRALAPWAAERAYVNFTETAGAGDRFFAADAVARLRAVKAAVDPRGVLRANHPTA